MKFEVSESTQVNHAGTLYGSGDTFEAENSDELAYYLRMGWVTKETKARATNVPAK